MITSEKGLRLIRLDPDTITDKDRLADFMKREMGLPDSFSGNLDALADYLSEISEETTFEIESRIYDRAIADTRLDRFIRMLSHAVQENPHLHIICTVRWVDGESDTEGED